MLTPEAEAIPSPTGEVLPKESRHPYQQFEWVPRHPDAYGHAQSLDDAISRILVTRGYTRKDIPSLIYPSMPTAEDIGIDLMALRAVGERFTQARVNKERVLAFGDADVDGVVSTYGIYCMLRDLDIKDVHTFTPGRQKNGYGFSEAWAQHYGGQYDLIVTVDCGITSKGAVKIAKEKGSDVIVIDHHHIQEEIYPDNVIVLHTTETSAAGMVYLVGQWFAQTYHVQMPQEILEYVAIAVFQDNMPMTRANHALVKEGLKRIRTTSQKNLIALANLLKVNLPTADEDAIAMSFGPTLNAPSRSINGSGMVSLQFLRAESDGKPANEIIRLAKLLHEENTRRKENSAQFLARVERHLGERTSANYLMYVDGEETMPVGLISPLSSRLMHEHNKPVFLGKRTIQDGELIFKFEARSPEGVTDFLLLIEQLKNDGLLFHDEGGGHTLAAGFCIPIANLPRVQATIDAYISRTVTDIPHASMEADCEVPFSLIAGLVTFQEAVGPFSYRFLRPTYVTRNVEVTNVVLMGKNGEKKHMRVTLRHDGHEYQAVMFFAKPEQRNVQVGEHLDILYSIGINAFNGQNTVQLKLVDFRQSLPEPDTKPVPALPDREVPFYYATPESTEVSVPEGFTQRLAQANLVGFDLDDTLKILNEMTRLRYACFHAFAHTEGTTDAEYFRQTYALAKIESEQWYELHDRIRKVSEGVYGNPEFIFDTADAYVRSWRTDTERSDVYLGTLPFRGSTIHTPEALWQYHSEKFIKGKSFLKRRIDEAPHIAPGAVSLLRYLGEEKDKPVFLTSNSQAHDLIDFEERLKREGFKGFSHKISATSLKRQKPHPYAFRNVLMHYPLDRSMTVVYIGNSVQDVEFCQNATDFTKFPSSHPIDPKLVDIVPVIISRGSDYSNLPIGPHARFGTLKIFEHYVRNLWK